AGRCAGRGRARNHHAAAHPPAAAVAATRFQCLCRDPGRMNRMHFRFVALLLSGLLAACSRGPDPAPQATAPAAKPKPASAAAQPPQVERPSLRVTTLDGADYDLAGQRGKWVIVNYWATWCGPCIKEMPELSA